MLVVMRHAWLMCPASASAVWMAVPLTDRRVQIASGTVEFLLCARYLANPVW